MYSDMQTYRNNKMKLTKVTAVRLIDDGSYHVLHCAQILGTLQVAVIFSQVCCCEAILVLDTQVHPVHYEDLTALKDRQKQVRKMQKI